MPASHCCSPPMRSFMSAPSPPSTPHAAARTPPQTRRRTHVSCPRAPVTYGGALPPTRHPTGQGVYGVSPPAAALGASSAARRAGGPAAASGAREPVGPRVSPRRSGRQSPAPRLLRAAVPGCCEPEAGGRALPGLSGPHAGLGPGFSGCSRGVWVPGRSRVSRPAREHPPLCATRRVAGRERDRGGDGAAMSRSRLGHALSSGGLGRTGAAVVEDGAEGRHGAGPPALTHHLTWCKSSREGAGERAGERA